MSPADADTTLLAWRVNTPGLLKEVLCNPQTHALAIPLRIFGGILSEVAERCIELDDPLLNQLMARLALYEQTDPYSPEYDETLTTALVEAYVARINKEKR